MSHENLTTLAEIFDFITDESTYGKLAPLAEDEFTIAMYAQHEGVSDSASRRRIKALLADNVLEWRWARTPTEGIAKAYRLKG